jgi:beta-barrel assembly-enhancing protease
MATKPTGLLFGLLAALLLGASDDGVPPDRDDPGAAEAPQAPPKGKSKASAKSRRPAKPRPRGDEPPACPHQVKADRAVAPPPRSMPEFFSRMGEGFARDPARGFQGAMDQLSRMEGPALQGVTLSIEEERQAGRKAREEYLSRAASRGYRVVNDPAKLKYLQGLVDSLAKRMANRERYPRIEVTLISAPVADGQSFPGGYLAFTEALLDAPDEATVAGVVAHELAHLDLGHLYGYAKRSKLAEATYSRRPGPMAGGAPDQFFTRQMALFGLMMNPYRPEHETEADCRAATWMYQEGYDPQALVRFFERMHERNRDLPADANPFFSFGRTHPYSLDRRRHVLERLAQLRRWKSREDLGLYAENLRRLVPRGLEPEVK